MFSRVKLITPKCFKLTLENILKLKFEINDFFDDLKNLKQLHIDIFSPASPYHLRFMYYNIIFLNVFFNISPLFMGCFEPFFSSLRT